MNQNLPSLLFVLIVVATWIVSMEGSLDAQPPGPYRGAHKCDHDHHDGGHDHMHSSSRSGRTDSNSRIQEGPQGGPPPLPTQLSRAASSARTYSRAADIRPSLVPPRQDFSRQPPPRQPPPRQAPPLPGSSSLDVPQFRALCENCSREFQPRSNLAYHNDLPMQSSRRNERSYRFDDRPVPYESSCRQSDRPHDEFRGYQGRPSYGFQNSYERTHKLGLNSQMSPSIHGHRYEGCCQGH